MSLPGPVAISLPFTPSSAAVARAQLKDWLSGLGLSSAVIEDSRLVLSELVGNAVRHARPLDDGTFLVAWACGETGIDIAVTDGGGTTVPHKIDVDGTALGGRGLTIVQELSERWWSESHPSRSTVHALLPVHLLPV